MDRPSKGDAGAGRWRGKGCSCCGDGSRPKNAWEDCGINFGALLREQSKGPRAFSKTSPQPARAQARGRPGLCAGTTGSHTQGY